MAQLLQHSIPTSRSFGWAPCAWHRARNSEKNCPSAMKCPHLPLSPALGTRYCCRLCPGCSDATPSTYSAGLRELPDASNSSSRFQHFPASCFYILMPAILLLAMQAALEWTTTLPLTWDGASAWHCWVGMEHMWHWWTEKEQMDGTARWAWST